MMTPVCIRASGEPFKAYAPCGPYDGGARKIDVRNVPIKDTAAEVQAQVCEMLNGWATCGGAAQGPVHETLEKKPHTIDWDIMSMTRNATRSIRRSGRIGEKPRKTAEVAIKSIGEDSPGVGGEFAMKAYMADTDDDAERKLMQTQTRNERLKSEQAFITAREGQNNETTHGWVKAMRALRMSGNVGRTQAIAEKLGTEANRGEDGRPKEYGSRAARGLQGSDETRAEGWTRRLMREGGGVAQARQCAVASTYECKATNRVIETLDPQTTDTVCLVIERWAIPGHAMMEANGGIIWDVHGLTTAAALCENNDDGKNPQTLENEIAARASAHAHLSTHPEGVIADVRQRMLDTCSMRGTGWAEQSHRWAHEACRNMERHNETPREATLMMRSALSDAFDQGAPIIAPDRDTLETLRKEIDATMESGGPKRATFVAVSQALRHAGATHTRQQMQSTGAER